MVGRAGGPWPVPGTTHPPPKAGVRCSRWPCCLNGYGCSRPAARAWTTCRVSVITVSPLVSGGRRRRDGTGRTGLAPVTDGVRYTGKWLARACRSCRRLAGLRPGAGKMPALPEHRSRSRASGGVAHLVEQAPHDLAALGGGVVAEDAVDLRTHQQLDVRFDNVLDLADLVLGALARVDVGDVDDTSCRPGRAPYDHPPMIPESVPLQAHLSLDTQPPFKLISDWTRLPLGTRHGRR